jgi:hypothetical protein
VLLQQTSNYIISEYDDYLKSKTIPDTPLNTMAFFKNIQKLDSMRFLAKNRSELLNEISNRAKLKW